MSVDPSNKAKLNEAIGQFKERVDVEKLLAMRVDKCLDVCEKLCKKIVAELNNEKMIVNSAADAFSIVAHDRVLSFAPAGGMASDARLKHPRGLYCRQILVLGHTLGQEESSLLAGFRVYPDGACSDGDKNWKAEESSKEFESYLVDLMIDHLFENDFFWPTMEELPDSMRRVTLVNNQVKAESLDPCIGFECALPKQK